MAQPWTVIALAGSLRAGSYNAALLRAAAELAPPSLNIEIASLRGIPLYDGDVEAASGVPDVVAALKERIAAAGGLLLATPEYNHSMPGVFKNAIDWLSRPPSDIARVFRGRPVGIMGASPGSRGTVLGQAAWLPVLRALGTNPWFARALYVGKARTVFDDELRLVDEGVRDALAKYLAGFAAFIAAGAPPREPPGA